MAKLLYLTVLGVLLCQGARGNVVEDAVGGVAALAQEVSGNLKSGMEELMAVMDEAHQTVALHKANNGGRLGALQDCTEAFKGLETGGMLVVNATKEVILIGKEMFNKTNELFGCLGQVWTMASCFSEKADELRKLGEMLNDVGHKYNEQFKQLGAEIKYEFGACFGKTTTTSTTTTTTTSTTTPTASTTEAPKPTTQPSKKFGFLMKRNANNIA